MAWMQYCCNIGHLILIWALLDVGLTTAFYPTSFNSFLRDFVYGFQFYSFSHSTAELWIFGMIRASILIGAYFGVWKNPETSIARLATLRPPMLILAVITWAYPIIKLLFYSEYNEDYPSGAHFWVIFSWSVVAAPVFYVNWTLLTVIARSKFEKATREENRSTLLTVNSSDAERQPLLCSNAISSNGVDQIIANTDGGHTEVPGDGSESGSTKKENSSSSTEVKYKKTATIHRLLGYSLPDWPLLLLAFIFMLISSVSEVYIPWYTGKVIEGITIDRDQSKFTHSIAIMALLSASSALAAGTRGAFFSLCMSRLNIRLRKLLFTTITNQEIGFFDTHQTGDITSRLTSDTATMSDTLSLNANIFLRSTVKAVGICIFMFQLSWQLSMVTLVGLPIIMGVSQVYGNYYEQLSKKIQDSLARANEVADEVCSSMRTVCSFAMERDEAKRYSERLQETYKLKKKEAITYGGYIWCSELFSLALVVATLYYGGHLVIVNMMSGGDLVSFILYQMNLGFAIESIAAVYTGLMQASGASIKVFEFIDRTPVIAHDGKLRPDTLRGHLEFRNVSFAYPSRPDVLVLKGVSFTVSPGEVVALVGPSGGGKSSCVNLLEHFYETRGGEVLLDGVPIQEYDHHYLHEKISLVGQEPVLYARTLEENIAYGLPEWDQETVERAAKLANAHDFITKMKDQYKSQAGEKGQQLSGGQKQRVAIARAVVRNPVILLLDEATSALDAESEHVVQEALHRTLQGRTVLLIAHRLSTVERADRIIVIQEGQVAEQGSHRQLLRSGGLYSKLVHRQLAGLDAALAEISRSQEAQETEEQLPDPRVNSGIQKAEIPELRVGSSPRSFQSFLDSSVGSGPKTLGGVAASPGASLASQYGSVDDHSI